MSKQVIFISGPYTHTDPVVNTRTAIDTWNILVDNGYIPIVPHASLLIHLIHPKPIEFWYKYDIEIMKRCDAVLRLPGESVGSDGEVKVARELGMPVYEMTAEQFVNRTTLL